MLNAAMEESSSPLRDLPGAFDLEGLGCTSGNNPVFESLGESPQMMPELNFSPTFQPLESLGESPQMMPELNFSPTFQPLDFDNGVLAASLIPGHNILGSPNHHLLGSSFVPTGYM